MEIVAIQNLNQKENLTMSIGSISSKIFYVRIKSKGRNINLVNIHAPTEKDKVKIRYDVKVILGEFNTTVGR